MTKIGTLKFVAQKNFREIVINDRDKLESFDGWVYPDGRKLPERYFPVAHEVFGDRLPDLKNFFRIDNKTEEGRLEVVPQKNELPRHRHTIGKDDESRINVHKSGFLWMSGFDSVFPTTASGKYFDGTEIDNALMIHGSDTKSKNCIQRSVGLNISEEIDTVDATVSDYEHAGEYHPTFNYMPILMFIGLPELD